MMSRSREYKRNWMRLWRDGALSNLPPKKGRQRELPPMDGRQTRLYEKLRGQVGREAALKEALKA